MKKTSIIGVAAGAAALLGVIAAAKQAADQERREQAEYPAPPQEVVEHFTISDATNWFRAHQAQVPPGMNMYLVYGRRDILRAAGLDEEPDPEHYLVQFFASGKTITREYARIVNFHTMDEDLRVLLERHNGVLKLGGE